jgi:hypothetical protein
MKTALRVRGFLRLLGMDVRELMLRFFRQGTTSSEVVTALQNFSCERIMIRSQGWK